MIIRLFGTSMLAAAILAFGGASAGAVTQTEVFSESCISKIELIAPQSTIDALNVDPRGEYQPATLTLDSCGLGSDIHGPVPVTIRLKGSYSFRTLDGKAAFKIKFAKANRLDGLKSFTLNNMVQDPSSIREVLGYSAIRRAGLVAPRAGFSRVSFNGTDFGLYANIETIDDRFADDHFESTGHLFEGPIPRDGFVTYASRDILPGSVSNFEIEEGDDDVSDLAALAAVTEIEADEVWWTELQRRADASQLLRLWAAISYFGIEDSYLSSANNYYLHSSESGVFTMIPSGIDQAFLRVHLPRGSSTLYFPLDPAPFASVLATRCFAVAPCLAAYLEQLHQVARSALEGVDLVAEAARLFAMTLVAAASGRAEYTRLEQCEAANMAIASLVTREHEVLTSKAALWGWGRIDSRQSSTPIDCAPFREPLLPTLPQPPIATVSPRASARRPSKVRAAVVAGQRAIG